MKRLFKYPYPKLTFLVLISIISYIIFSNPNIKSLFTNMGFSEYLIIFIAGLLFSFGFTTPIAIGIFIIAPVNNLVLAAILGGIGALLSDLLIFSLIKLSFMDEFKKISRTKTFRLLEKEIDQSLNKKIKNYLLIAFSGLIIASPLPDELGVSLLAGLTKIKIYTLSIVSFLCNSLGILIILLASH